MLALLGLALLAFLISSATMRSRMMITEHRYTKDLQAQRDLADRAEASRFTELRQYLDTHFREGRQRDSVVSSEFEKNMLQSQREMRTQLEQINHALMARLGELESRFDRAPVDVDSRPVDVPPRDRVKL